MKCVAFSKEVWWNEGNMKVEAQGMGRWVSRYGHGLVAAVLITLVTGYALLDVFVIPHEYAGVANAAGKQREAGSTSARTEAGAGQITPSEPVITDRSYQDADISITITEYRVSDTNVYVADVRVSSPEYLFSALAGNKYGRNIKDSTSAIAKQAGAILAVNGDFYSTNRCVREKLIPVKIENPR